MTAVVVTMPDKPAGRGRKIQYSDVKKTALEHGLPLLQPEKLKDPAFLEQLAAYQANLFIVVAFRMLPAVVWQMPELGTFNLHASLLPQYRGAAPINFAIINGETETGLTTFFLNEEIDKGAIIMREKVDIRPDETAGELHDELMLLGNKVVVETIKKIENDEVHALPQEELSENQPLKPQLQSENGETIDMKVYAVEIESCIPNVAPGSVVTDHKKYLKIALSDGFIHLKQVQQAGKKAMPIDDFLRGTQLNGSWKTTL